MPPVIMKFLSLDGLDSIVLLLSGLLRGLLSGLLRDLLRSQNRLVALESENSRLITNVCNTLASLRHHRSIKFLINDDKNIAGCALGGLLLNRLTFATKRTENCKETIHNFAHNTPDLSFYLLPETPRTSKVFQLSET